MLLKRTQNSLPIEKYNKSKTEPRLWHGVCGENMYIKKYVYTIHTHNTHTLTAGKKNDEKKIKNFTTTTNHSLTT